MEGTSEQQQPQGYPAMPYFYPAGYPQMYIQPGAYPYAFVPQQELPEIQTSPVVPTVEVIKEDSTPCAQKSSGCRFAPWILFGLGFLFWLPWLVGMFWMRSRHTTARRGAVACTLMLLLSIGVGLLYMHHHGYSHGYHHRGQHGGHHHHENHHAWSNQNDPESVCAAEEQEIQEAEQQIRLLSTGLYYSTRRIEENQREIEALRRAYTGATLSLIEAATEFQDLLARHRLVSLYLEHFYDNIQSLCSSLGESASTYPECRDLENFQTDASDEPSAPVATPSDTPVSQPGSEPAHPEDDNNRHHRHPDGHRHHDHDKITTIMMKGKQHSKLIKRRHAKPAKSKRLLPLDQTRSKTRR